MRKPREKVIMDSWHDSHGHAYISTKVHDGDNGPCIALNFQGDIETKDVWLSLEDAKHLIKALETQVKYLHEKIAD